MMGIQKTTEFATSLFHIGGLSGAGVLLAEGHQLAALQLVLIATACVVILTCGFVLVEVTRVKVRRYVRKHQPPQEDPPTKGESDA